MASSVVWLCFLVIRSGEVNLKEDEERKHKEVDWESRSREKNKLFRHMFFFSVSEMVPREGFMPEQLSSSFLFCPTCYFNTGSDWERVHVDLYYVCTIWQALVWVCVCLCVCVWVCERVLLHTTGPIWVPEGHSVVKEQEKLCHRQALTWTALQSPALRADILERLARAGIAA